MTSNSVFIGADRFKVGGIKSSTKCRKFFLRCPNFILCPHNWNNMNVKQCYRLKRLVTANSSYVIICITHFLKSRAKGVVVPVNIFLWSSLICKQNLVALCHIVWAYVGGSKAFWRCWGSAPRRKCSWPLPTCVIIPNLVVLGHRIWVYILRWARKIGSLVSRLSRPLKLIGTDTDWSANCTWLIGLVIHSNYGVSPAARINGDFSGNSQSFSHALYIQCPCWGGFPWNYVTAVGLNNYQTAKKFNDMCIRLDIIP